MSHSHLDLANFDNLFIGNPVDIETKLKELLPEAEALDDKSIYIQILSQIALSQAMQQQFKEAHNTLDLAMALLKPHHELARIRVLLERGRVYHQSGDLSKALEFFIESYEHAKLNRQFDFHTVNAAHMIAIVLSGTADKIKWNTIAIDLAKQTTDERCRSWLGALYNNLAQNYIEAQCYADSLDAFMKCKILAEAQDQALVLRGASWGIARAYRGLGEIDEALKIQLSLLDEYHQLASSGSLPDELLSLGRGVVYEELAELYLIKKDMQQCKKYAQLAYDDFSGNQWMMRLHAERIERMSYLKTGQIN